MSELCYPILLNELFHRYSNCTVDSDRIRLVSLLEEHLKRTIFTSKVVLTQGESSLLHNLIWITSGHYLPQSECHALWRNALRWPHSALKAEPFLLQHTLTLYGKGFCNAVSAVVHAANAVPDLASIIRQGLLPHSLKARSGAIVKIGSDSQFNDWFYGQFNEERNSPTSKLVITSIGALRALILAQSSCSAFEPTIRFVLYICGYRRLNDINYDEEELHQLLQTAFEWVLCPSLPRQYIEKAWTVIYNILLKFPAKFYACDMLLPTLRRHIDRLSKKHSIFSNALLCITNCLLLMACDIEAEGGEYIECLLRLCETENHQIIEKVCREYLIHLDGSAISDRMIMIISHGLLTRDEKVTSAIADTVQKCDTDFAKAIPFPFTDKKALKRSLKYPFWKTILLEYIKEHPQEFAVLDTLCKSDELDAPSFDLLCSSTAEAIIDGKLQVECLEGLLKCQIIPEIMTEDRNFTKNH